MSRSEKPGVDINALINRAVKKAMKAGLEAGRKIAEEDAKKTFNPYKATEARLYALPILIKKVPEAKRRLDVLINYGPGERSKSITYLIQSGRLSQEEIEEAMVNQEKARIAADEHEIATMQAALKNIENDEYYLAVKGRYFEDISDEEIAGQIPCDPSTVRRHRGRLVRKLAVWLYGAEAL